MSTLSELDGTRWKGSAELWVDPLGDEVERSECTIAIDDNIVRYNHPEIQPASDYAHWPLTPTPEATAAERAHDPATDEHALEIARILATMRGCNGNGIDDWEDLDGGFSTDVDGDRIPDDCAGGGGEE